MNDTLSEIRELFASSRGKEGYYPIRSLPPEYPAWIFRFRDGIYGAAIPYTGKEVQEEFNEIHLWTDGFKIHDQPEQLLLVTSADEGSREQFAYFCLSLVVPGENGELRQKITESPVVWWKEWKELVGNSSVEKTPFAVIGEMLVLCQLLQTDPKTRWGGPDAASRDLETESAEYEVKSTTKRYDRTVTISSQFQLQAGNKDLYLVFNRFEKKDNGISINSLVGVLVDHYGYSRDDLEKKLKKLGYRKGMSIRDEAYALIEQCYYRVDDCFPRIEDSMFVSGHVPSGIIGLTYKIDLNCCSQCLVKSPEINLGEQTESS